MNFSLIIGFLNLFFVGMLAGEEFTISGRGAGATRQP